MTTQQLRDDFIKEASTGSMNDIYSSEKSLNLTSIADYWLARMKEREKELVEKIIEDYGTYNDGCGCCSDYTLRDKLSIYFNIIKNN